MARTTSVSSAVPANEAAHRSWFAFKHGNPGSAQDPQLSYLAGYRRAVADMLVDQFQFRGIDITLERILDVFHDLAKEREAVRMAARKLD